MGEIGNEKGNNKAVQGEKSMIWRLEQRNKKANKKNKENKENNEKTVKVSVANFKQGIRKWFKTKHRQDNKKKQENKRHNNFLVCAAGTRQDCYLHPCTWQQHLCLVGEFKISILNKVTHKSFNCIQLLLRSAISVRHSLPCGARATLCALCSDLGLAADLQGGWQAGAGRGRRSVCDQQNSHTASQRDTPWHPKGMNRGINR